MSARMLSGRAGAPPKLSDSDAIRDERAHWSNGPVIDEKDLHEHRNDSIWFGMGIHMPSSRNGIRHRKHRKHRRHKSQPSFAAEYDPDASRKALPPGQRVQFLLNQEDDEGAGNEGCEPHRIFTEMGELHDNSEWREVARWIKFEEDVEEGGNRWSKPHVATLSLHSLFELRSCLMNGCVMLDIEASEFSQIIDMMLDKMMAAKSLEEHNRDPVREALLKRHTHQFEYSKGTVHRDASQPSGFLQTVRSIADVGRNLSHARNLQQHDAEGGEAATKKKDSGCAMLALPEPGSVPRDLDRESSIAPSSDTNLASKLLMKSSNSRSFPSLWKNVRDLPRNDSDPAVQNGTPKGNQHFMKKVPPGAEASNVLIGEVDFLDHHVSAFIRMKTAILLGDLTEVPVPTRFLFVLLGPKGHGAQFREIGRAVATLMSDEVFHDVAYKAHNRGDLLDGVDEFLDQVTVLPPGEWDPNIRIEPPQNIPSQDKRKEAPKKDASGHEEGEEEEEGAGHAADPTLKRTGRLFGGLIADIKRKVPWFWSDFKDAFSIQCVASVFFMYFAMLAPVVTFGGLLEEATGGYMAAIENLLAAAITGTLYCFFAGQPLTFIGATGPVLVFESIIYSICKETGLYYLSVRLWTGLWTALILIIMVATDASALVTYITRFTEESFSCLISLIFIVEAFRKLGHIFSEETRVSVFPEGPNSTCFCVSPVNETDYSWVPTVAKKYHLTHNSSDLSSVSFVKSFDLFDAAENATGTNYQIDWPNIPLDHCTKFHGTLDGTACYFMYDVFLMSTVLMIGTFTISFGLKFFRNTFFFPSRVRMVISDFAVMIAIILMVLFDYALGIATPKLNVPDKLQPTHPERGWIIHPFHGNPWWTCIVTIFPALLACILIFMDQQITAVIVNRRENKLKKGCGYHLDLFVLSLLIIVCAIMGIPYFVAATVMSISHVQSLKLESECAAPGEQPKFMGVREQRVSGIITFVMLGASVAMTNVLRQIPMPVLFGVFLYMGFSSLRGVQLVDRILLLLMPMKYQPDLIYLRHVRIRRVHLFTLFQAGCLAMLWLIKSIKSTSIVFPIMLVVMVGVRKVIEIFIFDKQELKYLDDEMPEISLRSREDKKKAKEKEREEEIDQPGPSLTAVQTEANLHIPLASGNVMKIPLSSLDTSKAKQTPQMNISEEMQKTGMWKHIESQASLTDKDEPQHVPSTKKKESREHRNVDFNINESDEDFQGVTIRIDRASPTPTRTAPHAAESSVPLLARIDAENIEDIDKAESAV